MTTSRRRQRNSNSDVLGRFLRWWGHELAAMVPPALRPKNRPSHHMLWVEKERDELVFWRFSGQARHETGRLNISAGSTPELKIAFDALRNKAGAGPVGICLPANQLLRKEITLPLAATENLSQVLGFELSRQTPYTVDQAYYDQRVLREDRSSNRLNVLLGVAPKLIVDEVLAYLTAWGVRPHAIAARDELESSESCLNLLPVKLRPKPSRAKYWLYAAMTSVTLILFAALLGIPLWQKRQVVIALQPVLHEAQQKAGAVDMLRREQEHLLADYNYTVERKLTVPATVGLLEEVTRLLPDSTWLQQLEIHGAEISLQGNTRSSAKLVGLFEQSSLLENANFKSPLVKVAGGEERFQLVAAIKPIDFAEALAWQRNLEVTKKPTKAVRKTVQPYSTQ